MPVRAVLFDFDGVIADTENVHVAAWERTFARMGWDVPPETCARSAEVDDRVFLAEVFAEHGLENGDLDGWLKHKQAATVAMLEHAPRVYPGVVALVEMLRGRVEMAIVSGTYRENIATTLESIGLRSAFSVIVAKEDVKLGKPGPEAYQLALRRLGIPAALAVAIEDSPTGVDAARSAGIRVLAVGHRHGPGTWCAGESYIDALGESREAFDSLGVV